MPQETKRIALPTILATRDPAIDKDGMLVNCYAEQGPDSKRIVKRPGMTLRANLGGDCPGQGAFYFVGNPVFIACDTLFTELPPQETSVALSGESAVGEVGTLSLVEGPSWVWVVKLQGSFQKTTNSAGCTGPPFGYTKRVWTDSTFWSSSCEFVFGGGFSGCRPSMSPLTWDVPARVAEAAVAIPTVTGTYYSTSSGIAYDTTPHPFDVNTSNTFITSPCMDPSGLVAWDQANNVDNNSQVSQFAFVWIMPENIMYALDTGDWNVGPPPPWTIKTAVLDALQVWNRRIYYPTGCEIYWEP